MIIEFCLLNLKKLIVNLKRVVYCRVTQLGSFLMSEGEREQVMQTRAEESSAYKVHMNNVCFYPVLSLHFNLS